MTVSELEDKAVRAVQKIYDAHSPSPFWHSLALNNTKDGDSFSTITYITAGERPPNDLRIKFNLEKGAFLSNAMPDYFSRLLYSSFKVKKNEGEKRYKALLDEIIKEINEKTQVHRMYYIMIRDGEDIPNILFEKRRSS